MKGITKKYVLGHKGYYIVILLERERVVQGQKLRSNICTWPLSKRVLTVILGLIFFERDKRTVLSTPQGLLYSNIARELYKVKRYVVISALCLSVRGVLQ